MQDFIETVLLLLQQFEQKQSNLFGRLTFIMAVIHMQKRLKVVHSQLIFDSSD